VKRSLWLAGVVIVAAAVAWAWRQRSRVATLPPKPRTVAGVLAAIGPQVDARLRPDFAAAGIPYPPEQIVMLAFKEERRIDILARGPAGALRRIRSLPILGASGREGLKRREGDLQVPEGFYRFELLNPNSNYHLSLRVGYPNADDRNRAGLEGQDPATLGGDIMIHGGSASIGCLAVGDPAAEDLFVLAARTGLDRIEVLIFPRDFRRKAAPAADPFTAPLYERLAKALKEYGGQAAAPSHRR
jgi:hypothetical protein